MEQKMEQMLEIQTADQLVVQLAVMMGLKKVARWECQRVDMMAVPWENLKDALWVFLTVVQMVA